MQNREGLSYAKRTKKQYFCFFAVKIPKYKEKTTQKCKIEKIYPTRKGFSWSFAKLVKLSPGKVNASLEALF